MQIQFGMNYKGLHWSEERAFDRLANEHPEIRTMEEQGVNFTLEETRKLPLSHPWSRPDFAITAKAPNSEQTVTIGPKRYNGDLGPIMDMIAEAGRKALEFVRDGWPGKGDVVILTDEALFPPSIKPDVCE